MTFDEVKKQAGNRVVVFYGAACAPCQTLKPLLRAVCHELNERPPEEINIAGDLDAARDLGIRTVPTVVLVKQGAPQVLFTGMLHREGIARKLLEAGLGS
jgi:thioredoxin 1